MKILHLEDNADKARLIQEFASEELTLVTCWKEWQQRLSEQWDLLILDNHVPLWPGDCPQPMAANSVSEARRFGYSGPIIIITGAPDKSIEDVEQYDFSRIEEWSAALAKLIDARLG